MPGRASACSASQKGLSDACIPRSEGDHILKIKRPILLGAMAGPHCSTELLYAGFQPGNFTPVIGYSVTYATANVIFSLLGPVVVVLAAALGTS